MQLFGGGSEVNLLAAPPLSHLCHCHMTFVSIEHVASPILTRTSISVAIGALVPENLPLLVLIFTSFPVYLKLPGLTCSSELNFLGTSRPLPPHRALHLPYSHPKRQLLLNTGAESSAEPAPPPLPHGPGLTRRASLC